MLYVKSRPEIACEPQTHFRSSLLSEGEKRRPEMRLRFAGYPETARDKEEYLQNLTTLIKNF